jgi:hypothetical protein
MAGDLGLHRDERASQQLVAVFQIILSGGGCLADLAHHHRDQFALGFDLALDRRIGRIHAEPLRL